MTPERWAQIATLVEEAMALPAASRAAYLQAESGGDDALERDAADLLSSHDEEEALRAAAESTETLTVEGSAWTHDRFERHGLLGRGGFGAVYRAYDRLHRQWVALKVLQQVEPIRLDRFKQEFRRTTTIRHPNVVRMHELFSDGEEWFFTMEHVDGVPVLDYIRGKGPAGTLSSDAWPRLRHAFEQLTDGICAIHDAGIVHGDIKPPNVLVTGEGRLVLLDFGLVRDIAHQPSVVAGTPAYMAPEQLSQEPVSSAADWYSVGMLLYEALTGSVPFGGTLWDVVWKKQREDVRLPDLPWVPESLVALCDALLERQPDRRPSAAQIRVRLLGDATVRSTAPVAEPRPIFVGRTAHLEVLRDAFDRVGEGHAVAVHLQGLSGMGKSALVRQFLDRVRQDRPATVILTGRCYESESVPFKALDELIDGLSRYLGQLGDPEVDALLPRDASLLGRVFPALRRVPRIGAEPRQPVDAPPVQELRDRALAALTELLERLGSRRQLVLWIDDLQWGDSDSVRVLRDLQQPSGAPCLLLILSYRLEDVDTSPVLQALTDGRLQGRVTGRVRELAVDQLPDSEARELAATLYADLPVGQRAAVVDEASGNPLFIHELARYLRERGSTAHVPRLIEMIQQRVARLEGPSRRLLETIAIAGQPLERSVAIRASGTTDAGVEAQLLADFLIRTSRASDAGKLDTYHDKVRESVLALMPEEVQRASHARLAEAIEADGQADPERLVRHFRMAGIEDAAYRFALEAASVAENGLAFDRAASLYRLALELRERLTASPSGVHLDDPGPGVLGRRLGDALTNAGRTADAAIAYLRAAEHATGGAVEDLRRMAADQMMRGGQIDAGLDLLTATLRESGLRLPRGRTALVAAVVLARLHLRARGLRYRPRPAEALPPATLRRIDRLWMAGATLTSVDPLFSAYLRARHLVLALHAGEPHRIAMGLALEALQRGTSGAAAYPAARAILDQAREIAARTDRPEVQGIVLCAEAAVAYFSGHIRDALRYGLEGQEVLTRAAGVSWELASVRVITLSAMHLSGQWRDHARSLQAIVRAAEGNGDRYTQYALPLSAGSYVDYLAADDPAGARAELDDKLAHWGREEFDLPQWSHLFATVEVLLYERRYEEAWQLSGRFRAGLRRTLMTRIELIRVLAAFSRARCALALGSATSQQAASIQAFMRAARRSRAGLVQGWGLLIEGVELASRGQHEGGTAKLRLAEERLTDVGAAQYVAVSRRRRGQLIGGDAGAVLIQQADAELMALGAANPARMADRLVPGFKRRPTRP